MKLSDLINCLGKYKFDSSFKNEDVEVIISQGKTGDRIPLLEKLGEFHCQGVDRISIEKNDGGNSIIVLHAGSL